MTRGEFYIGDSPIETDGDNIAVKGTEYQGTPGRWELLTMKEPQIEMYTDIMIELNTLKF